MLGPRGTSGTCRPPHNPSEADRENMVDRPPIVVHAGVGSIILSEMAQNPGLVDDAVREKLTVPGMLAADGVVPLRNGGAPPHRLALLWQTPADFVAAVNGCLSKKECGVADSAALPFVHSVLCADAAGVPWSSQYVGRRHESPRAYFTETRTGESAGISFSGGVAARMTVDGLESRPVYERIQKTAFLDWLSETFPDWKEVALPASVRIPVTVGPYWDERQGWADALNRIVDEYHTLPDDMFVAVCPSTEAVQIGEKIVAVNNAIDRAFGDPTRRVLVIAQGRSTLHVFSLHVPDFSLLQMYGQMCIGSSDYAYYESLAPPSPGVAGVPGSIQLQQAISRAFRWFR